MRIHNFILGSRSLIKDFSIRFFAIVLFLSILVFSGSSLTLLKIQNQKFLQESSIIFQEFKKFIVPPLWHYDDAEINAICRTFLSGGMVAKITIFSENNKPLYTFGNLNEKNILFESFSEDLFFKAKKIGKVDFYTKREKYLESNRYYFITTIIAIALISVFISIATWKLLHIYVSRPLAKLLLWINQIKKGDYESVNIDFPQKEIQDVVHHFALMVDKIKEREQELRKSEQQYRSLFENTGTATFVIEEDMTVSQINAKCEELIGYSRDEIEGRMKTSDFVGDENLERIKKYHIGRRNEVGVYPSEYELELVDKNGDTQNAIIQVGMISGTKKSIASIIDITPLRRAEAEMRSSEKRFRSLVANIPGAIYRCDKGPDWTMRFFSEAISDICGYPASDFIGNSVRAYKSIIHPDDRGLVDDSIQKSLESGEPFKIEYRIHDAEGEVRWVYESGMGVLEEGGKAQYIDGAIFDITERKISDEALRESESRYRTLFDSANDTIFIMKDDTFVDCNQKALVMFGCTREQIIGHRPHEFSPPTQPDGKRSKDKALEKVKAVFDGKPQFFEWKHRRSDATLFDAEVSLNLVELNNGLHVQAITRDITKRKEAEAAMRISHRIINHSIDMICVAGFDGYFKVLNPAWERVLDWSREELLSKPWTDFVHPDDREVTNHSTSTMIGGTEIRQFENRYISKDGSVKWLSWTAHPYPDEEIIFAVARDVTESKRTENEMAQLRIQLKNIIDSMPSLLVAVDLEGRVNLWNTQVENKTGVSAELAQGQFLPEVFPQMTIGLDKVRDTIANKKPHIDTKVPQTVDHGIHYQDITVYPLIANDVEGAVIRVDDVTERVRMEEMVIQSEKMLSVGGHGPRNQQSFGGNYAKR